MLSACASFGAQPTPVPSQPPAAAVTTQADLVAALASEGATVELGGSIEQAFFHWVDQSNFGAQGWLIVLHIGSDTQIIGLLAASWVSGLRPRRGTSRPPRRSPSGETGTQ